MKKIIFILLILAAACQKIEQQNEHTTGNTSEIPTFSNIRCLSGVEVDVGWKYSIYADGIIEGDGLELISADNLTIWDCKSSTSKGKATIIIPPGLMTGRYQIAITRGDFKVILRTVSLIVTPDAVLPHETRVIAHRGYWHVADGRHLPHNSIASLQRAQNLEGVYSTETDIWMTKDNILVLNHDAEIDKTSIQESEYLAIKNHRLSNGEHLVTFENFLNEYLKDTHIKLLIHIKDLSTSERTLECAAAIVSELRKRDILDKVEWLVTDYSVASYLVNECKDETASPIVDYSNDDVILTYEQMAEEHLTLNYDYATILKDPECIRRAHQAGIQVVAWTVNIEYLMLKLMALGVDYFNTDRPDMLIELKGLEFISHPNPS